jgi:hypothetical protein
MRPLSAGWTSERMVNRLARGLTRPAAVGRLWSGEAGGSERVLGFRRRPPGQIAMMGIVVGGVGGGVYPGACCTPSRV